MGSTRRQIGTFRPRHGLLIDDRAVRTKHVREFLAKDFPKDSLPSAEEARALASAHRAAMELFSKNEGRAAREAKEKDRREELQRRQQPRRAGLAQGRTGWPNNHSLASWAQRYLLLSFFSPELQPIRHRVLRQAYS